MAGAIFKARFATRERRDEWPSQAFVGQKIQIDMFHI